MPGREPVRALVRELEQGPVRVPGPREQAQAQRTQAAGLPGQEQVQQGLAPEPPEPERQGLVLQALCPGHRCSALHCSGWGPGLAWRCPALPCRRRRTRPQDVPLRAAGQGRPPWPTRAPPSCCGAGPTGPPGWSAVPWHRQQPWPARRWPAPPGTSAARPSWPHHQRLWWRPPPLRSGSGRRLPRCPQLRTRGCGWRRVPRAWRPAEGFRCRWPGFREWGFRPPFRYRSPASCPTCFRVLSCWSWADEALAAATVAASVLCCSSTSASL